VIDERLPEVKAMLYCTGLTKLFVLELGPLLTALLLAGRIGGSFAGEVGTMVATNQNRLLKNLGVSTRMWSLVPSVIAALITAPILTLVGTGIALFAGSIIAEMYDMGSAEDYWDDVYSVRWFVLGGSLILVSTFLLSLSQATMEDHTWCYLEELGGALPPSCLEGGRTSLED
jgi:ABC-type transporter Mla maintaining outer membrane lipid asymmetry permease subunit MlaE